MSDKTLRNHYTKSCLWHTYLLYTCWPCYFDVFMLSKHKNLSDTGKTTDIPFIGFLIVWHLFYLWKKNIYDTSLYTFYFLFVFCLCTYQLVWHFFDTTFFILVGLLFSGICICSHFTECYKIWFNKYSCKSFHFKCYCYMGVCFAAVNIQCMMCGVLYTQINLPFLRTSIFLSCAYLIMFSKRLSLCDVIVGISHYIVSILLLFMYKICLAL